MKKLLLSATTTMLAFTAMAELNGDGYYRVQNAITKRYAYLLDNKGKINGPTSSVDVGAIELYKQFSKACSDPSTVFFLEKVNSSGSKNEYDIAGQGTSLHGFLNRYMNVIQGKSIDGLKAYYAYGVDGFLTKYLGDYNFYLEAEEGIASVDVTGERRLWYIYPIEASSENYFGISPTLTNDGKYYAPMYAGFPYDAYSDGIRFFAVSKINPWAEEPAVALKELTGVIPAGVPVIIECSNPLPSDNRLNVGPSGQYANVGGNLLKGVYFNNDDKIHENRVAYDRKTMRILTVKDGKLVFDTADLDYLPRNQAYLQLAGDAQCAVESYKVLTEEEFDAEYAAVDAVEAAPSVVDVYSADGRLVKAGIAKEDVPLLGKGLYILRAPGFSEKLMVR